MGPPWTKQVVLGEKITRGSILVKGQNEHVRKVSGSYLLKTAWIIIIRLLCGENV